MGILDGAGGGHSEYRGPLDAVAAATGMQAARLNSVALYETAKLLFEAKRFPHSQAFSILAIEEIGKRSLLFSLFLNAGSGKEAWRGYRNHMAKTSGLNKLLVALAKGYFPDITPEALAKVSVGPSPEALEQLKQLSLYSDCFEVSGNPIWLLPEGSNWEEDAKERLAEAASLALNCRDQTPAELELWAKHLRGVPRSDDAAMSRAVEALDGALREAGFQAAGRVDLLVNLSEDES